LNTTKARRLVSLLLLLTMLLSLGIQSSATDTTDADGCGMENCTMSDCTGDMEETADTEMDCCCTMETENGTATSGTIGSSAVTWTLQNGILTIGGSGSTATFTSKADQPWAACRDQITQVWFDDPDAVAIANLAYWFTDCVNLEVVELPPTISVIGTQAFAGCTSLKTLLLYYSAEDALTIVDGAFRISELSTEPLTLAVAELHDAIKNYAWLADNRQVEFADVYGIDLASSSVCGGCSCMLSGSGKYSLCAQNSYDACYCTGDTDSGSSSGSSSSYSTYSVTFSLTNVTKSSGSSYAYSDTTYTATLSANTGYSLPSSITVTVGGTTLSSSRYTYSSSTGSISIPYSYITGNLIITASGTATKYTVTWDAATNGGTVNGSSSVTTSVAYGATAAAPSYTPVKTGYAFKGWYTTATGAALYSAVTISGARTFYAQFTANSYTVTWNGNGGADQTSSQTYGTALTLPDAPTRVGYTFDGWYTAADGGTQVTDTTIFTNAAATTYYAHWTADTYTIRYYNEGGEPFDGTQADGYPTTHAYGTDTALPDASKEGYYFLGWYTDSACTNRVTGLAATDYVAEITLYAKWELIEVFSVTVPAMLSLAVSQDGIAYAGSTAEIVNNSTGPVAVTGLTITANSGWTLVPYTTNMAAEKVDSKEIGFSVNGAETTARGSQEALHIADSWTIQKDGTLPLTYAANVSAMSQPVTDANALTLVFVLAWAD
jgi:uncharacterized repeat protein (TIGR02543 family)